MDTPETSDPLSIIPSETAATDQKLDANHQVLPFLQPNHYDSETHFELRNKELKIKREELEFQRQQQQLENKREQDKIDRENQRATSALEIELKRKKFEHGIRVDAFQRGTKAVLGLLCMTFGIFLHVEGDEFGRFFVGGGAAFFGVSMANISISTSKDKDNLLKGDEQ